MDSDLNPPSQNDRLSESADGNQGYRCNFFGNGNELFEIFVQNLFLTLITLGGFYFQAKVRTRRYIWAHSSFAGDRFSYHGTGWELFRGWLKAFSLFGGFFILTFSSYLLFETQIAEFIFEVLFYVGLAVLTPLAQLGAMRYRLSRTSWRGVRFSFRGELWPFMKLSLRGLFLTLITVGFYFPEYHRIVRGYIVEHSLLGSMRLGFDGVSGTRLWKVHRNAIWFCLAGIPILGFWYVYGPWEYPLVGNIGTVLIAVGMLLGSSWAWIQYLAERQRFYWNHTKIGDARFKCTITNRGLFYLYVGNFFLMLGSLGFARPWVKVRTIRYDLENLQLIGEVDFAKIIQETSEASGTGDELSGLLDLDGVGG